MRRVAGAACSAGCQARTEGQGDCSNDEGLRQLHSQVVPSPGRTVNTNFEFFLESSAQTATGSAQPQRDDDDDDNNQWIREQSRVVGLMTLLRLRGGLRYRSTSLGIADI